MAASEPQVDLYRQVNDCNKGLVSLFHGVVVAVRGNVHAGVDT